MSIIEAKAQQIADDMGTTQQVEQRVALDPMMILTIVKILVEVIKAYKACKQTPEQAAVSMRDGGILERWRLRKAIRKHVDDEEMHGHVGLRMFRSTLNVSKQVKDEEVKQMFAEISDDHHN